MLCLCECARQGSWQGVCSSAAWAVGTSAAQLLCGVVCGAAACCLAVLACQGSTASGQRLSHWHAGRVFQRPRVCCVSSTHTRRAGQPLQLPVACRPPAHLAASPASGLKPWSGVNRVPAVPVHPLFVVSLGGESMSHQLGLAGPASTAGRSSYSCSGCICGRGRGAHVVCHPLCPAQALIRVPGVYWRARPAVATAALFAAGPSSRLSMCFCAACACQGLGGTGCLLLWVWSVSVQLAPCAATHSVGTCTFCLALG